MNVRTTLFRRSAARAICRYCTKSATELDVECVRTSVRRLHREHIRHLADTIQRLTDELTVLEARDVDEVLHNMSRGDGMLCEYDLLRYMYALPFDTDVWKRLQAEFGQGTRRAQR